MTPATPTLITQLTSSLDSASNQLQAVNLSGLTVASTDLADASLQAKGYVRYQNLAAPAWKNGTATGVPAAARVAQGAAWTGSRLMISVGFLGASTYSRKRGLIRSGTRHLDRAADVECTFGPPRAQHGLDRHLAAGLGGFNGSYLGDGAEYTDASATWAALPDAQCTGRP
jgi:hypothetical protein